MCRVGNPGALLLVLYESVPEDHSAIDDWIHFDFGVDPDEM